MLFEIYVASISTIVLILYIMRFLLRREKTGHSLDLQELTVVIPFRNEEDSIDQLIKAIKDQTEQPNTIYFIDDHSDDKSPHIVKKYCQHNPNAKYIKLLDNFSGKKRAIEEAMKFVSTEFVLTLDADTWFDNDFFNSLSINSSSQLIVRPVVLKPKTLMQQFYAMEQLLLSSFNYLLFPFYPLTGSGANMVYRKDAYTNYNDLASHQHIASGDDHFFLRRLYQNKQEISIVNQKKDAVYTNAPGSFIEYLNQRVRWFSKTTVERHLLDFFVGIFLIYYLVGGFVLLVIFLLHENYIGALFLFLARIVIDASVLLPYAYSLREFKSVILLPIQQIVQPILMITVFVGSLIFKPKWKGR
tara:strand:+ start:22981 stop:24054 length:1074 start_codon:yes stop_codon:yes gene_type:complete